MTTSVKVGAGALAAAATSAATSAAGLAAPRTSAAGPGAPRALESKSITLFTFHLLVRKGTAEAHSRQSVCVWVCNSRVNHI